MACPKGPTVVTVVVGSFITVNLMRYLTFIWRLFAKTKLVYLQRVFYILISLTRTVGTIKLWILGSHCIINLPHNFKLLNMALSKDELEKIINNLHQMSKIDRVRYFLWAI